MSLEQAILEAVRALPAEKQQEVLNHAARLRDEAGRKSPFKRPRRGNLWVSDELQLAFSVRKRQNFRHVESNDRCWSSPP